MNHIKIPKYNLAEELINSISHGIGGCLAITALVLCIVKASTAKAIIGVSLYGSFMIIMYTISCIYHSLSPRIKGKKVLRVIDHIGVLLMEAGTYMPVCLSLFTGYISWIIFSIVWLITIIAIILNSINVDKYQLLSVICNLLLGWGILILIKPLINICPKPGILFLVLGGLIYTIGAILFGIGSKKKYIHSIFHFFVIAGSIFHFFFIYLYCI